MHPSKFGDTYDMAKMCMLRWLAPDEEWFIHPMYFPPGNQVRDDAFPGRYADFLELQLVRGNIAQRQDLVNAVANDPGHLFLDPDTGLRPDNGIQLDRAEWRKFVSEDELIEIACSTDREQKLVLVYDQSIDRRYRQVCVPRQQIRMKLRRLHDAGVHAVAYVSHIAFIWASSDPGVVNAATRRLLCASGLPIFRFVDDGCAHIQHQ